MGNKSILIKQDSLLDSLVLYTKLFHKPYTAEALMAGLPVHNSMESQELFSVEGSKSLFSRVAGRAGLKSALIQRPISKILQLQLPVILLLSNDYTCILESFSADRKKAKIIYPEGEGTEEWLNLDDLEGEYLGFAFMLKKEFQYDNKESRTLQIKQKHWFWNTILLSKHIYVDVIAASLLINIFVLATPLFTMNVYDRVIPYNAQETLIVFTIGIVMIYLIDFFLKYTRSYMLEVAAKKSDIIMSSIIFEKILDLKLSSHPSSVGSFANNLKNFEVVRSFFTSAMLSTIIDLPFAIIFLLFVYYIGGNLVLVPLIIIFLILLVAFSLRNKLKETITASQIAGSKKNARLIETLQNIETVKSMSMSGKVQWEWEEVTGEIAEKNFKSRMFAFIIPNITAFLSQLNRVLIIVVGVYMIQNFELTMGGLIACMLLSTRAVSPIGKVAGLLVNYAGAKIAFVTLDEILSRPSERPSGHQFLERPKITGNIEFKNVTFTYPNSTVPAIKNVSFIIKPGEKIAIIGRIGSGKSTIAKLILRLYDADEGAILIDGIDIGQIDPADLRRSLGYIPQDVHLFNGTLKDNIISSERHPSDKDVIRASIVSGTNEFVHTHPKGYDMLIRERESGLSGGERQSVGIARGLLTQSKIMLMDEPTNSMDQTSENNLINNLKDELINKTVILVTQKFALLSLVDRVIVMSHSKLIMDGPKDEVTQKLKGRTGV
ncbi:MAG: type I secretion system permease/ATPase [Sulfurimonas sp.]|nr:type I secretion system permease/ATPase [Sulfurimonas sp.]